MRTCKLTDTLTSPHQAPTLRRGFLLSTPTRPPPNTTDELPSYLGEVPAIAHRPDVLREAEGATTRYKIKGNLL